MSKSVPIHTAMVLLLVAVCWVQAFGADVYVSKSTGKDSNAGTKDKPKKLLWKVLGKLSPGDTVRVAEGEYYGRRKSGLMP